MAKKKKSKSKKNKKNKNNNNNNNKLVLIEPKKLPNQENALQATHLIQSLTELKQLKRTFEIRILELECVEAIFLSHIHDFHLGSLKILKSLYQSFPWGRWKSIDIFKRKSEGGQESFIVDQYVREPLRIFRQGCQIFTFESPPAVHEFQLKKFLNHKKVVSSLTQMLSDTEKLSLYSIISSLRVLSIPFFSLSFPSIRSLLCFFGVDNIFCQKTNQKSIKCPHIFLDASINTDLCFPEDDYSNIDLAQISARYVDCSVIQSFCY